MKMFSKAALVIGLMALGSVGAQANILWTLNNVSFQNGDSATGTFTTNNAVTSVLNFSLQVTGPASVGDFVAVAFASGSLPGTVGFGVTGFTQFVSLPATSSLTSAGGTVTFTTGGVDCWNGGTCSSIVSSTDIHPSVTGQVIPEPAMPVLIGTGLCLLGLTWRRRTIKSQPPQSL
jgi:hypothetical protein